MVDPFRCNMSARSFKILVFHLLVFWTERPAGVETANAIASNSSAYSLPKLHFIDTHKKWEKIDDAFVWRKKEDVVLRAISKADSGNNLVTIGLECEAPYTVKWEFDGFINTKDQSLVYSEVMTNYKKKLISLRLEFDKRRPGSTGSISCVLQYDATSELRASFFLFVPSFNTGSLEHYFRIRDPRWVFIQTLRSSSNTLLSNGECVNDEVLWVRVKCPVSDPRVELSLFQDNKNVTPLATFNPVRGFELFTKDRLSGVEIYECRTRNSTIPAKVYNKSIVTTNSTRTGYTTTLGKLKHLCGNNSQALYLMSKFLMEPSCQTLLPLSPRARLITFQEENDNDVVQMGSIRVKTVEIACLSRTSDTLFQVLSVKNIILERGFNSPRPDDVTSLTIELALSEPHRQFVDYPQTFTCIQASWMGQIGPMRFEVQLKNEPVLTYNEDEKHLNCSVQVVRMGKTVLRCPTLPQSVDGVACHVDWPVFLNLTLRISAMKKITLSEFIPPAVDKHVPDKIIASVGKAMRLSCPLERSTPLYNTTWTYSNATILDHPRLADVTHPSGFPEGTNHEQYDVVIPFMTRNHKGWYTCKVENELGEDSLRIYLDIAEPVEMAGTFPLPVLIVCTTLILATVAVVIVLKKWKKQKKPRQLNVEEVTEFFDGRKTFSPKKSFSQDAVEFMPYMREFEVTIDDCAIDYENLLGSGQYAYVVKGMIKSRSIEVAVKVCKPTTNVETFKSFLAEVKIMLYVNGHPNVVSLLGASTSNIRYRNLFVFLELCPRGSLEKYLRENRPRFVRALGPHHRHAYDPNPNSCYVAGGRHLSIVDFHFDTFTLIKWAEEIARGMEYLNSKSVIHADLATRNVLLDCVCTAKISDFGLSKKLYESCIYTKKTIQPLPWRWMAPESLKSMTFSTKSDVYSFGITLWEMFTIGDVPYANEGWTDGFLTLLQNGGQLRKPEEATMDVDFFIKLCLMPNPDSRPSFKTLGNEFQLMRRTSLTKRSRYKVLQEKEIRDYNDSSITITKPSMLLHETF